MQAFLRICRLTVPAVALALCLPVAAPCAQPDQSGETKTLVISGTGDSEELLRALAGWFGRKHPGVTVSVPESIGSSGGIKEALAGKAVFARTARPLRPEEAAKGLVEATFARTPILFAVNPSVTGVDGLTAATALSVFSGGVNDWSEIGGAPGPISRVCRELPEIGREVLNGAIPGFADLPCSGQAVAYSTPEAVAMIADHPGTVGYVSLSAMPDTRLRPLDFEGAAPTPDNLRRGTYPLGLSFSLVYKPPLPPEARQFLDALADPEAAAIMARFGCLPLSGNQAP